MKFHLATSDGNLISAYGDDYVRVGLTDYRGNLVIMPDRIVLDWLENGFDTLTERHFATLAELKPELVLLGTGRAHRFPHPRLSQALSAARIGLETMTTPAACRTYNIIATEGRRVAAALIVEPASASPA